MNAEIEKIMIECQEIDDFLDISFLSEDKLIINGLYYTNLEW